MVLAPSVRIVSEYQCFGVQLDANRFEIFLKTTVSFNAGVSRFFRSKTIEITQCHFVKFFFFESSKSILGFLYILVPFIDTLDVLKSWVGKKLCTELMELQLRNGLSNFQIRITMDLIFST